MIDINYTRMSNINNCNMKKIECVIMDWAGTSVDYGCFAPVAAFQADGTDCYGCRDTCPHGGD